MRNRCPYRVEHTRAKPKAERIAAAILANADILNLRTQRLAADIRATYGGTQGTAMAAIEIARAAA